MILRPIPSPQALPISLPQAFQLKKQQKLNELDRVVVLRLHQILHHGDRPEEPPTSIFSCLVFPEASLTELSLRISAVKEEKKTEKLRFKSVLTTAILHVRTLCYVGSCTTSMCGW